MASRLLHQPLSFLTVLRAIKIKGRRFSLNYAFDA
jgi:hypothetical protein